VCILIAKLSSLIHPSHSPTEVFTDRAGTGTFFELSASTGWVSRIVRNGSTQRMCWLPHKRRHNGCIAWSGQKVVIGAESGIVTILDFSDV
jgi:hypothetical protein